MNSSAVSGYYVINRSSVYCDIVDYINGLNFSNCYEIFQNRSFVASGYYKIQAPNGSLMSVYCESGNPAVNTFINAQYSNDTLWDGQQCGILEQPC